MMSAFPDKARVLKLAEQIQARLAHAQQLKMSGQQVTNPQVARWKHTHTRLSSLYIHWGWSRAVSRGPVGGDPEEAD